MRNARPARHAIASQRRCSEHCGDDLAGAAYSVVSREQKLKIVGVADLDPESMRGPTRAKVFLPLKLAESLHVMQPTDLREIARAASDQPVYSSISVRVKNPSQIQAVEDAIKKMGFTRFPSSTPVAACSRFFRCCTRSSEFSAAWR